MGTSGDWITAVSASDIAKVKAGDIITSTDAGGGTAWGAGAANELVVGCGPPYGVVGVVSATGFTLLKVSSCDLCCSVHGTSLVRA